MRRIIFLLITALFILLCGCSDKGQVMDGDGMLNSYRQISQEEAARMMEQDDGHVIVDVRRQDEYDAGHIPGAILIPNESIDAEPPAELPDKNQIILICIVSFLLLVAGLLTTHLKAAVRNIQ